jgi:hypothetical protein
VQHWSLGLESKLEDSKSRELKLGVALPARLLSASSVEVNSSRMKSRCSRALSSVS